MIKISNINKKINSKYLFNKPFTYEFKPGESYAIIGPSGAGKSTILNIISLLDKNYEGTVEYENIDMKRKSIGYMFQNYGLVDEMTVKKNLKIVEKDIKKIETVLDTFGLKEKLNEKVSSLSGGEQQRISFCKIILKQPKIIICDEPTGNLDEVNSSFLIEELVKLQNPDNIIIIVTHDKVIADRFNNVIDLASYS